MTTATTTNSKKRKKALAQGKGPYDPCDWIVVDPVFESMTPPSTPDEDFSLEKSLLKECRDPLLIWQETKILLDGHRRLRILRKHGIPFLYRFISLPNRYAAEEYMRELQFERRNLSSACVAYLRGKCYLQEKRLHGEWSATLKSGQNDHQKTSVRLAKKFGVGEATIRREARFAAAVDKIADNCGPEAKKAILTRDSRLSRGIVLRLSRQPAEEQKRYFHELVETGKRLRRTSEDALTITLPRDPATFAAMFVEKFGELKASEIMKAIQELLNKES